MTRSPFPFLVTLVLTSVATLPGGAQEPLLAEPSAQELVDEAARWAAGGDTTLAIAVLRRALEAEPDNPDAVFALGTLLARSAPPTERDFKQRSEAEDLLDRAYRLRGGDPEVLIELAMLKNKQNIRVDARRLLEQALEPDKVDGLDPEKAADAYYQLARIAEDQLFDFEHLVFLGSRFRQFGEVSADPLGGTSAGTFCPQGVTYFCFNYTRPRDFNLLFEEVAKPASDTPDELYPLIEDYYRTALSYDPRHEMAARGLMALYLRQDRVDDFEALAAELVEMEPGRPYPWLFQGLALSRAERWDEAELAFTEGLRRLPPDERQAFQDVTALLQRAQRTRYAGLEPSDRRSYEDVLWAKSDPLYLVPGNERWLEHVSRVTYAELNFGNPERGQRGWESDRGLVYIRWGPPRRIWKITTENGSGRWIIWNYRIDAPSFIFFSQAGYQTVRFDQSANTSAYAQELAETESASVFRSRAVTTWIDLPYQVARFRGSGPNLTRIVAYAGLDPSRFLLFEGDSVQAAFFLFTPQHRDTVEIHQSLGSAVSGNLAFTLEAYPADYEYALEGLAAGSKVAGTERGVLSVTGYPEDRLSVSDLVVADGVRPRVPEPRGWSDFSIAASRDLAYAPDEDVHLYFEIYGLQTDAQGVGRYRLELTVEDVTQQGLVSSVVRSLGDLVGLGEDRQTRVQFDRTAEPIDGLTPEYLSLSLPEVEPGTYRIQITVEDTEADQTATLARTITITDR